MVIYELTHVFYYHDDSIVLSQKCLGFFGSYESAQSAICEYRKKAGFCDNPNSFSLRRRVIEGNGESETFFEVLVYLHSEDYEFEVQFELGLFADESMAEKVLSMYCLENSELLTSHQLVVEKIINKCTLGRREWIDGFDFED